MDTSAASVSAATWPTVVMPRLRSLSAVTRPDAPEPLDRQRMEEGELAVGRHHEQTVGLRHATRHLGEELRPGHPDGDRQTDLLENLASQPHCDLGGGARDPSQPAHIEERLVDRESLDQRRRVFEHPEHRLARLGVRRHPGRDHDRLRAQAAGLCSAHRGADAACLGLVAGRQHDPRPDDHGPAAQATIISLLDRRIERIEVSVQDRRLVHEHMFARVEPGWIRRRGSPRRGEPSAAQLMTGLGRRAATMLPAASALAG